MSVSKNELNFNNVNCTFWAYIDLVVDHSNISLENVPLNEIYEIYVSGGKVSDCVKFLTDAK